MIGCLGLLLVLALLAGEAFSFVVAHHVLGTYARDLIGGSRPTDTILPIIAIQVVMMVWGVVLVKRAIATLPLAMMGSLMGGGSDGGRLLIRMLAGILLIVPGFFLDLIALVLLLPPVNRGLAVLGQRVMMSIVRRQMGKMMGAAGGFPGGFPGGAFPGMQPRGPLQPDARVQGNGKVVDVTAERVDKG